MALMVQKFDEPELDAIAQKASAERQEDRYAGAALLSLDIANFRSDLPVEAFSTSRTYRFRKFVRRHRLPVAFASLASLVIIGGLVGVTEAYRDAARARDNAQERFAEVRALSNFLLFDLYDELDGIPGNTQALNDIADRARHYLDVLSKSEGTSPAVRLEAALAYKRLSDVLGTPISANLGRRAEAAETLNLAIEQLRVLYSQSPEDGAVRRGLAEALYSQAVFAFIALDNSEMAHEAATESAALFWDLAGDFDQGTYAPLAIDAEIEAAQPLAWIGRGAEAVAMQQETLSKMEAHIARYGRTAESLGLLARTQSTLAETIGREADGGAANYADALQYSDQAIATYRETVAASDRPDAVRRSMAVSLWKRSLTLYSMELYTRALRDLDEAEAITSQLLSRDPADSALSRTLAAVQEQKALTLAHAGQTSAALALVRSSTAIKRGAAAREPDNPGRLRELALNLLLVGDVAEIGGLKADACSAFREGAATYERLDGLNGLSEFDRDIFLNDIPEVLARNC